MLKYAFFNNSGVLESISPRHHESIIDDREIAYQADVFSIYGCSYDLSKPDSILSLPIPDFDICVSVLDLSYITKIRCGLVEDHNLIPAFVQKALDLMLASKIGWLRGDYLQVIRNYYRCGMVSEGEIFEKEFRKSHPALFGALPDYIDEGVHLSTKYHFENQNRKYAEYEKVKHICPDLVPKTVKGYLQIRTRRTERFLKIQSMCEKQGIVFDTSNNRHFCQKYQNFVEISEEYDHTGRTPRISSCVCSLFKNHVCNKAVNEHGLSCIYPVPDNK